MSTPPSPRKRARSTLPTEGEAIDEFDGKAYPLRMFPSFKQPDGTYKRGRVSRPNIPAWRNAKRIAHELEKAKREGRS